MGASCCCAEDSGRGQNQIAVHAACSAADVPFGANDEKRAMVVPAGKTMMASSEEQTTEPSPATLEEDESFFEILIVKDGPDDKLGMDVKHTHGKLEVVHIFEDGAVQRANIAAQSLDPPGEILCTGDIIHLVNKLDNDHQMVAECRLTQQLNILASRPP